MVDVKGYPALANVAVLRIDLGSLQFLSELLEMSGSVTSQYTKNMIARDVHKRYN